MTGPHEIRAAVPQGVWSDPVLVWGLHEITMTDRRHCPCRCHRDIRGDLLEPRPDCSSCCAAWPHRPVESTMIPNRWCWACVGVGSAHTCGSDSRRGPDANGWPNDPMADPDDFGVMDDI